jgi:hypothetical protein
MDTNQVLELCKRGEMAQADAYAALCKFAEAQRKPGRTIAQGFSDYIQKDEIGQRLFATYKALPNSQFDMTSPDRLSATERGVPVAKVADTDWSAMVALYAKSYGLTEGAAISQIMATPEGMAMFRKQMRAERLRNPDFSENDHLYEDACDAAREESRVAKANSKASEFMDLVSQMRSKFPAMTLSDAMERTQSLYPEAWRKYREMDVKAAPADPNAAPLSGRPTPSRAPLWQGPNTSSELTPPRKFPVADDTVRYKSAAAATAEANFVFFTKILHDASGRAGKPWSVEKCIATLRQCPAAAQYFDAAVAA